MTVTKKNILHYLYQLKNNFKNKGITSFALFGSFASGKQTLYSDIDIAIKKDKDFLKYNSSYDYFNIVSQIKLDMQKRFHRNIDIFDLNSNSPLKDQIEKELIYV